MPSVLRRLTRVDSGGKERTPTSLDSGPVNSPPHALRVHFIPTVTVSPASSAASVSACFASAFASDEVAEARMSTIASIDLGLRCSVGVGGEKRRVGEDRRRKQEVSKEVEENERERAGEKQKHTSVGTNVKEKKKKKKRKKHPTITHANHRPKHTHHPIPHEGCH